MATLTKLFAFLLGFYAFVPVIKFAYFRVPGNNFIFITELENRESPSVPGSGKYFCKVYSAVKRITEFSIWFRRNFPCQMEISEFGKDICFRRQTNIFIINVNI